MSMEKGILGNAIRKARMDHQMSQEELAERVGITPTHLKHIESEHRKPSLPVLFDLVEILHISLDSLLMPEMDRQQELFRNATLLLGKCDIKQLKIVIALMEALLENG
ncbi:helix-turn-helix transcriptional regulator [Lachnospiraceae bacterium JLR.KK008]